MVHRIWKWSKYVFLTARSINMDAVFDFLNGYLSVVSVNKIWMKPQEHSSIQRSDIVLNWGDSELSDSNYLLKS